MRMYRLASILFVMSGLLLTERFDSARAQDAAPEIQDIVRCGGAVALMGVVLERRTDDRLHIFDGFVIAYGAIAAVLKDHNGGTVDDDVLAKIDTELAESITAFIARNGDSIRQVRDPDVREEILDCYEDLLGYISDRGLDVLTKDELTTLVARAGLNYLRYGKAMADPQ